MVLDDHILREKLINAWKLRSDEASFSAALSPLVAECGSDEEFRTLFTKQILANLDSVTSSNLLQSYFKFHTRSGYIDELLVIQNLICLKPTTSINGNDDIRIKFLVELLFETLKSIHLTAQHGLRLAKPINALAKWFYSTLCFYSEIFLNDAQNQTHLESMLILLSNAFLLLFNNSTYFFLWMMTIKSTNEQFLWKDHQMKMMKIIKILNEKNLRPPSDYQLILEKLSQFNVTNQFYEENIQLNPSIFNILVPYLVINQLHKSSSILLCTIRFYEKVSKHSLVYLRFLQASLAGLFSSTIENNHEYQQRWSAYIHFQLPRLLAKCFETSFDQTIEAIEHFLLYNEFLLNRLNELFSENIFQEILQRTKIYFEQEFFNENQLKFDQLFQSFHQIIQQDSKNDQLGSSMREIIQNQRRLEKDLYQILTTSINEEILENLINNLGHYLPMIFALDQYYSLLYLLLSAAENYFDIIIYLLCYITSVTDDLSEDFGCLDLPFSHSSSSYIIYVWLKKYWLSRSMGHALFASSLETLDFVSTVNHFSSEENNLERQEFLNEIQHFNSEQIETNYSEKDYLKKTILLFGEFSSLTLNETKETVFTVIQSLIHISHGSLVHVLLWLFANYQIASDDDRNWIQEIISNLAPANNSNLIVSSTFDQIKHRLWLEFIDNRLSEFDKLIPRTTAKSMINYLQLYSSPNSTLLLDKLFEIFLTDEFLNSEQIRALYLCSKSIPIDLMMIRIFLQTNSSNGIHETDRTLFFQFILILSRRCSSTRCLLDKIFPYLFNMKSNEFMLEPNVQTICLLMTILLTLELNSNENRFLVKPWILFPSGPIKKNSVRSKSEDLSVIESFKKFFDFSSMELFESEIVRPVNYFVAWFQTIIWMFSNEVQALRIFLKPKLISQIAEYLPLQYPIEKVLSILNFSNENELELAAIVITKDFNELRKTSSRAQVMSSRKHFSLNLDENFTKILNYHCLTKTIHSTFDYL